MLACSVALRPQQHRVAADIAEAAAATDAPALFAIFATLTDDPGNALDIITAFVGQNMVEAASAAAAVSAGSSYSISVLEAISAAVAAQDASIGAVSVARHAMIDGTQVNSDGTARQANVNGTMVNL